MLYAVERYMDVLKVKAERETVPDWGGKRCDKYHYFDVEQDAKDFIIARAEQRSLEAENEFIVAKRRAQKCKRKFGIPRDAASSRKITEE